MAGAGLLIRLVEQSDKFGDTCDYQRRFRIGLTPPFIVAIQERREPNSGVAQVLLCYRALNALEMQMCKG